MLACVALQARYRVLGCRRQAAMCSWRICISGWGASWWSLPSGCQPPERPGSGLRLQHQLGSASAAQPAVSRGALQSAECACSQEPGAQAAQPWSHPHAGTPEEASPAAQAAEAGPAAAPTSGQVPDLLQPGREAVGEPEATEAVAEAAAEALPLLGADAHATPAGSDTTTDSRSGSEAGGLSGALRGRVCTRQPACAYCVSFVRGRTPCRARIRCQLSHLRAWPAGTRLLLSAHTLRLHLTHGAGCRGACGGRCAQGRPCRGCAGGKGSANGLHEGRGARHRPRGAAPVLGQPPPGPAVAAPCRALLHARLHQAAASSTGAARRAALPCARAPDNPWTGQMTAAGSCWQLLP